MSLGNVHRVKNLEEALWLYAAARATGNHLPTFTTSRNDWPTFQEDIRHTYTVEHDHNGTKFRWSGVMIYVIAINDSAALLPSPETIQ